MIFNIVYAICFTAAALAVMRVQLHMFQLNSYKPGVHLKWCRTNLRSLFRGCLPAFLAAPLLYFSEDLGKLLAAGLMLPILLLNRPRKAKKPLVYTLRVKRLIATIALFLCASAVFSVIFRNTPIVPAALSAGGIILMPLLVLLCNLINRPLELAINRWYINDAKKLLRAMPKLTVIGITGSYGKTSVKFYLQKILSAQYNVLMTPESFNTPLGVVKTIRSALNATHDIFICEMGAKNIGDIKEICDIVNPAHGIVTSIGPAHLESFKSIENIIKTKLELADALPKDGMLFLNYDNEQLRKSGRNCVSYGTMPELTQDYAAYDISVSHTGSAFSMRGRDGAEHRFSTKLIGRHNVCNICAAIAVADKLDVPMSAIVAQVKRLECAPHRLQLLNKGNCIVIDDAYNSNPAGAKAALDTLGEFDGYRVLVTPGIVELGALQEDANREFGKNAASVCDFVATVGRENADAIRKGLTESGFAEAKYLAADTLGQAMDAVYAADSGGKTKIILLENDLPDNYR